jgi:hypothetical protein
MYKNAKKSICRIAFVALMLTYVQCEREWGKSRKAKSLRRQRHSMHRWLSIINCRRCSPFRSVQTETY